MPDKQVMRQSVTAADHKKNNVNTGASVFNTIYGHADYMVRLPPSLPKEDHYQKDRILFSTTKFEPAWANAVKIASAESGRRKPQVFSKFQNRQESAEMIVMSAGLGVGWDQYINGLRRHFSLTNNGWFVEVIRAGRAPSSPIVGLIQLHSLRCYRTGNANTPVEYMDADGRIHELQAHQVIFGADQEDTFTGYGECAAEDVYDLIFARCAMNQHLSGKITGQDISEIEFVTGAGDSHDIQAAMENARLNQKIAVNQAKNGAENSNIGTIKNKVIVPVIGDRVSGYRVPLAGLPENYSKEDVENGIDLQYALSLFVDPQQLNPNNVARANLSSNSAQIAETNENRGDGLFSKQIETMHNWIFGSQVEFRIFFRDFKMDRTKAELDRLHIENAQILGLEGQARIDYLVEREVIPDGFIEPESEPVEEPAEEMNNGESDD